METARDNGLHLSFFSCNEVYWRVRWEDDHRTMVCYKESASHTKIDPKENEWTGTFQDSRKINPLGSNPQNSLTGSMWTVNAWRNDILEIPKFYGDLRFWRDTEVEKLKEGEVHLVNKPGILGHEWNEDIDNGHRPPGLI